MFSLWILSFLEYYGIRGHQAAIQKHLIRASLQPYPDPLHADKAFRYDQGYWQAWLAVWGLQV